VNGEQAGFENLALVEHQAVDAAHERGLVVHLGPIPETAAQLTQPADPDRQPGFLTDLANDRLLERLAPPREAAGEPPLPLRRPQPVAEQQHPPVVSPDDPGHPDPELRVQPPRQPPLPRPGGPPGPDQQVTHGTRRARKPQSPVLTAAATSGYAARPDGTPPVPATHWFAPHTPGGTTSRPVSQEATAATSWLKNRACVAACCSR